MKKQYETKNENAYKMLTDLKNEQTYETYNKSFATSCETHSPPLPFPTNLLMCNKYSLIYLFILQKFIMCVNKFCKASLSYVYLYTILNLQYFLVINSF